MRHIIRINVHGRGYVLYSGSGSARYEEFPLDARRIQIPENYIPENYMFVQRRIDDLLSTAVSRPYICISNQTIGRPPVVGYGCLYPIEDERGRTGLSLIHALYDEAWSPTDIVVEIVRKLSPHSMDNISRHLTAVAQGALPPQDFIQSLTSQFTNRDTILKRLPLGAVTPIQSIIHDCAGAPLAWVAMSASHTDTAPPWEIYEEYSALEELLATVSTAPAAQNSLRLSTYISNVIFDNLLMESVLSTRSSSNELSSRLEGQPQTASASLPVQPLPMPHAAALQSYPAFEGNVGVVGPTPGSAPPYSQIVPPPRGRIVVPDLSHSLGPGELSLEGESGRYVVTLKNCDDFFDTPFFYVAKIHRKFLFRKSRVHLLIPKFGMTKEVDEAIKRFREALRGALYK